MLLSTELQPGQRMVRATMVMQEIPYAEVPNYLGQAMWFSTTADCRVTHGPMLVIEKIVGDSKKYCLLNNQEPIELHSIRLCIFMRPAATMS